MQRVLRICLVLTLSMMSAEGKGYPEVTKLGSSCQEIGLVAFMFFFELLFSYVSLTISFYVSFTNLFPITLFLIC